MKNEIREKLTAVIEKEYPDFDIATIVVDETDAKFGDFSSNIAMIIGKQINENPKTIADKLASILKNDKMFIDIKIAGPGFINFVIAPEYLQKMVSEIIDKDNDYGKSDSGKDLKINVEFISANPTGPLTVGNSRGGVIGDVLSNVLSKSGWQVIREYYFNDAGGQIDVLGHSVLKDDQAEYKGEYIDELHEKLKSGDFRQIGKEAAQVLISEIKKTTLKMGIKFDNWFAEGTDLREKGKVTEIIEWLKQKNLLYEKDGAWWFRSMQFGDDKDRVVIRSNGEPTYFGVDCAYHENKFVERKFDRAINIWGPDHHGDLARVKGFVKALGYENKFNIIIHQLVKVTKEGKEVRMSKRAGNFVLVDDVLNESGTDAYRFFMLRYAPTSHLVFDLDLAKEKSQKNPVFYVQYAYARIHSILEKSEIQNSKHKTISNDQNLKLLKHPAELSLIKELIKLPELVEEIVGDYQVQKLPTYAMKLAESFHHFYENCPVIKAENEELSSARLELLKATQIVLKNTLDLMGISAPEKM